MQVEVRFFHRSQKVFRFSFFSVGQITFEQLRNAEFPEHLFPVSSGSEISFEGSDSEYGPVDTSVTSIARSEDPDGVALVVSTHEPGPLAWTGLIYVIL